MFGSVNSIQLPVPVALSCTHVPPLELTSVCSEVPTPLLATARFSASNISVPLVEVTLNAAVALCDKLPLVPVIVSVEVPAGVEPAVVTVSVDEPGGTSEDGLKLAVAPAGSPAALRLTVPEKALRLPTFTV